MLGRLVLATIRDDRRRHEIEGDLLELWRRRAAAGRRDLRRAYLRDLFGLLLAGSVSLAHRVRQAICTSFSGGFAMW
jgi:hypothetical protein